MNKDTELLDKIQKVAIDAIKPVVKEMMKQIGEKDYDLDRYAENLLAKIGTRIMFKEKVDNIDNIILK